MTDAAEPESRRFRGQGERVGRYLLLEVLGRGGMGVVYRAFDPELERLVALKLVHAAREGDELSAPARDRLVQEAKALARVAHPHVVSVFDVGTSESDVFIAMELVEGETLTAWLREQPRTWRAILDAFLAAGEGLAAAHAADVVHRDFKPDNVICGRDGRIRVLDFGIATARRASELRSPSTIANDRQRLSDGATATLGASGTPRYMAPEQHLAEPTDPRTDEFSFCVALYEALQDEHPFGDDQAPMLRAERMVLGRPRTPSTLKMPQWLRKVLIRGMEAAPDARYPNMLALLAALRADPAARRRTWASRLGVLVLAALAAVGIARSVHERSAVCAAAGAKAGDAWNASRRDEIRQAFDRTGSPFAATSFQATAHALDAYTDAWRRARTDACEATELRHEQSADLLDLRMICLDDRLAAMRAQVAIFATADPALVAKATAAAEALPPVRACSDAQALRAPVRLPIDAETRRQFETVQRETAEGRAMNESGRYLEARPVLTQAVVDARRLGFLPAVAEATYALGISHDRMGSYKDAEQTLTEALLSGEAGRSDAVVARAWTRLAWVVGEREARYAEAETDVRHAHATVARLQDAAAIEGEVLDVEGSLRYRQGRYDEAVHVGRIAVERLRAAYGSSHFMVLHALVDVADAEMEQGLLEDAVRDFREVQAMQEGSLGKEHPDLAATLNNQGIALKRLGRFAEATACYERALAIREHAFGPDHAQNAATLYNLGEVLAAAGRYEDALPIERRSLALLTEHVGPEHPDVAEATNGVADTLRHLGRLAEARASYARALSIDEKALGTAHPALAAPLTGLGELACDEKHPVDAIAPLSRALTLRESGATDPLDLAATELALGRALWDSARDRSRGRALVGRARDLFAEGGPGASYEKDAADAWIRTHRGAEP